MTNSISQNHLQNLQTELFYKFYTVKNFLSVNKSFTTEEIKSLEKSLEILLKEIEKVQEAAYSYFREDVLFIINSLINLFRPHLTLSENIFCILNKILNRFDINAQESKNILKEGFKSVENVANIHIGVMYHKNFELFRNNCLYPIHIGKACSESDLSIPHDWCGDNISDQNIAYAELTGLYWIWKNIKADIKGMMHYRRFIDINSVLNPIGDDIREISLQQDFNSAQFLNNIGLTSDNISRLMENYDIITRNLSNFAYWSDFSISSHYKHNHIQEHLDIALQIIKEDYPEYFPSFLNTFSSTKSYFCNVFIMKSGEFDKYCSFLFDVLAKVEKTINYYDKNLAPDTHNARWAGYLGERLTGAYIRKRIEDGILHKEFPMVMVNEPGKNWTQVSTYQKNFPEIFSNNTLENLNTIAQPVVSIIIDCKKFDNCSVNSVISQSLKNIEIILINYSKAVPLCNDERIIITKEKNLKNILNNCRGKYIHFMDGQDHAEKDFYLNVFSKNIDSNPDIIISTYQNVNPLNHSLTKNSILPHKLIGKNLKIETTLDLLMESPILFNKLFNKDFLLNNIDFTSDIPIYIQAVLNAKKVDITRNYQYKRLNYNDTVLTENKIEEIFKLLNSLNKKELKVSSEINEMFNLFKLRTLYYLIVLNNVSIAKNNSISDKILIFIKNNIKSIKISQKISEKLDFYIYDKKIMELLSKATNKNKMREIILKNSIKIALDYKDVLPEASYLN